MSFTTICCKSSVKSIAASSRAPLTLEPSGEKYVTRRLVVLVGADTHLAKRSRESSHLKIEERENEPSDYNHSFIRSWAG